jgi:dolichyl-phosphate beta-glucosyltransferase
MSTGERPQLSVVIPAYNESERLAATLPAIDAYLAGLSKASEILVVDDGSTDGTAQMALERAPGLQQPLRVLRYAENRGKGHALKVGFAASRGEAVLFSDADLSTPIEETEKLLGALERAQLAIGSRWLEGSKVEVHQPWYRERMGGVFSWLVRLAIADVADATCGFKAFRGAVGRDLFARVRVYDWSFDAEVLRIARERGYALEQVPVHWEDREGTRVRLLRDSVVAFLGLLRVSLNASLGRYRDPHPIQVTVEELTQNPADSLEAPM